MWIAKRVTVLKFGRGGVGGSTAHTRGAPPKVTENAQNALCCHLVRDWAALLFVDGLVMPPSLSPPAPLHHQGKAWQRAGWEAGCSDPSAACLPLSCLALCAVFEAGMSCGGCQPSPVLVQRGRGCGLRESNAEKGKPCSQPLCLCCEIMPICCSFTCLPEC